MDNLTIISYLSVLGAGGIIGAIVKHFLDKSREKNTSSFAMKKEAYMKAIATISGLADKAFLVMLKNNDEGDISAIAITDYIAEIETKIAGARLIATKDINKLFGAIAPIIVDGMRIVTDTLKSTKKIGDKHFISLEQPAARELVVWKKAVNELENRIVSAIQKDLGIKV